MCRELLQLAEDGDARGLAFVVKIGRNNHEAGLIGDYSTDPTEALSAAVRLKNRLLNDDLVARERCPT